VQEKIIQHPTILDAHVHIYDCFDPDTLLDGAIVNFRKAAKNAGISKYTAVIMLTETANDDYFARFSGASGVADLPGNAWSFGATSEAESLRAIHRDGHELLVVAGRQIVTSEKLEILALATLSRFVDGQPATDVVEKINAVGGIAVAPWGVGKWWGKRGHLISELMQQFSPQQLAIGDNSGRPWFMHMPTHFRVAERQSRRILPGSDPLPFAREATRVGSVGCVLRHPIDELKPAESIKRVLIEPGATVEPYMKHESLLPFLKNQIAMQLRKRTS